MDIWIGAEYLLGLCLIQRLKNWKQSVYFYEVEEAGWELQKACNKRGINAFIFREGEDIHSAIIQYKDYFEYARDFDGTPFIRAKAGLDRMTARFGERLPSDITLLATQIIEETL